jgi:hypothetical protein
MKRTKLVVIASFFFSFLVFADYELIRQDDNVTIKKDGNEIKSVSINIVKNEVYIGTISSLIENIKSIKVNSKKNVESLRNLDMEERAKIEELGTARTIGMLEESIDSIINSLE